jgi:hypothetical protein
MSPAADRERAIPECAGPATVRIPASFWYPARQWNRNPHYGDLTACAKNRSRF